MPKIGKNKQQYNHIVHPYYLAIKSNKLLTHAKTWMTLKSLMLSEVSHA